MEHIRHILPQANSSRGEGVEFTAAAAIAAVNDVLRRQGFSLEQAQATSLQFRRVRIRVNHGAIAGRIQQRADGLVDDANALLRQRFPALPAAIEGFITRLG